MIIIVSPSQFLVRIKCPYPTYSSMYNSICLITQYKFFFIVLYWMPGKSSEVDNYLQKVYWRVHSRYIYTWKAVRKIGWGRQTEKLVHNAVASETSADPTGNSGAGMALPGGHKLRQGGWALDPCISQLLTAGFIMEGVCTLGKAAPFGEGSLLMTAVRRQQSWCSAPGVIDASALKRGYGWSTMYPLQYVVQN